MASWKNPGRNAGLVLANLVGGWLSAPDGVVAELESGARVADLGCAHGASTLLLAQAFPASTFVGSDHHAGELRDGRADAGAAAHLGDRAVGALAGYTDDQDAATAVATKEGRSGLVGGSCAPSGPIFARVRCPVTVVHGTADRLDPPRLAERLAEPTTWWSGTRPGTSTTR